MRENGCILGANNSMCVLVEFWTERGFENFKGTACFKLRVTYDNAWYILTICYYAAPIVEN